MNEHIEPEELTELFDEDLEMWAQGGTRILPRSQLEAAKSPSFPPVACAANASVPPPSMTTSHAPLWAAAIGMAAVFFLATTAGGIFYALHRSHDDASALANLAATTIPEPREVTLTQTTDPIAATATATTTTTTTSGTAPKSIAISAAPVRFGTIQTFAAGAGKPVFVDGKQIGVGGARMKTACGKHNVSVGSGKAKSFDVPCSGAAITVGTPDGA